MSASKTLGQPQTASSQGPAALLLVLMTVLVAYGGTAATMVSIWSNSATFAHAYIVPPIVLWLIWRKRAALALVQPKPCPWILLPMGALAALWLLGDLASVGSITQLTMTGLLILAVPAVLGVGVTRVILFPLGFLLFAVPLGEFLLPQLMSWTADFTVLALRATGIPVFREGNQFVIPSGNWSVVEACSGIRYLIASFMVGTLFAYLNYRSLRRRLIFVAVSITVPIVANWVRAYLIVMLGHLTDNKVAVGVDHLVYGWLFFGLVIGLMFAIGSLWAEPEAASSARSLRSDKAPWSDGVGRKTYWATAVAASLVVLLPQLALHRLGDVPSAGKPQLTSLTTLSTVDMPSSSFATAWKPAFQQASAEMNSLYAVDGRSVGVYIGYYREQDHQRKLVSSGNELVKSQDPVWVQLGADSDTIVLDGDSLTVRAAVIRAMATPGAPERRLRVWQVYWVGDKLTSSDFRAKIYAALDRLLRHSDDAAAIVFSTDEDQPGGGRAALESFTQAHLGEIVAQLRVTRDGVRAGVATNDLRIPSLSKAE